MIILQGIFETVFNRLVEQYADEKVIPEEWDLEALLQRFEDIVGQPLSIPTAELEMLKPTEIQARLLDEARGAYELRIAEYGPEIQRQIEKMVLLQITDNKWMEHLSAMDDLREGIGLRAYGQRDPLLEYRFEAFEMFQEMVASIQEECVRMLFRVRLAEREAPQARDRLQEAQANRGADGASQERVPRTVGQKVGRNDPCPCGSGKKYKRCCGK